MEIDQLYKIAEPITVTTKNMKRCCFLNDKRKLESHKHSQWYNTKRAHQKEKLLKNIYIRYEFLIFEWVNNDNAANK